MANTLSQAGHDSVGAWAKRCYQAGRAAMEAALRPHDLGSTQWYVLHQLATQGPTMQRGLLPVLQIERATLSVIVATLVRKHLVAQMPDEVDQRQKRLELTPQGAALWKALPDLSVIHEIAFGGIPEKDLAMAIDVLRTATSRLEALLERTSP